MLGLLDSEIRLLVFTCVLVLAVSALNSLVSVYLVIDCPLRIDIGFGVLIILIPTWMSLTLIIKETAHADMKTHGPLLLLCFFLLVLQSFLNIIMLTAATLQEDATCRKELGWFVYLVYWVLSLLTTILGVILVRNMPRQEMYEHTSGLYQQYLIRQFLQKAYKRRRTVEGWRTV